MNIKNIIAAASVVLLSVLGSQDVNAQRVVHKRTVTVRTAHRHRPVVTHRRNVVVRHRVMRHRSHRSHRTHSATVIVR